MNYREFAIGTAREVGEILMKNFGKIQKLEWNKKTHFKTKVDELSDSLIRNKIIKNYPEHNIYSEEAKDIDNFSEFSWVYDPLDGTIPYTFGITDHFSVCISLVKNKTPILGVIYSPKRKELYVGESGKGAYCNNKKISANLENNINRVIMGLDSGKETKKFKRSRISEYYERLLQPDGITCTLSSGCASIPLSLVARGKIHAYLALSLEPWDMAAAVIINREACAKVTNISGDEWSIDDESILSANPILHKKILNLIK